MASDITPGTQQLGAITNPTGLAGSDTQLGAGQLTPVEHGRTAAKSKYTTTTNTGGKPIGGDYVTGAVASVTLTTSVSGKGDATYTGAATTASGYNKSGATITYIVASNVASGTTVAAGGSGYAVGDVLTIADDTGVTYTVATIS